MRSPALATAAALGKQRAVRFSRSCCPRRLRQDSTNSDDKLTAVTQTMWILRTDEADLPEQTFRILPGGIKTVGRATGADFIIDAALVSRVHCRLEIAPSGDLQVRDLNSTNGTFVNGERVEIAHLKSGDRLRVGRVELVALHETDAASARLGTPE